MEKMVSMKLSKEQMQETSPIVASKENMPSYPYGLRLELNDESMKKLGLEKLPSVGEELTLHAKVIVERVSQNDTKEGKRQDMSLQITEMCVGRYEEEKEDKPMEKKLYQTDGKEYKPKEGKTLLVDL